MLIDKDLYIVSINQIARNFKNNMIRSNPFIVVKSLKNVIFDIYKKDIDIISTDNQFLDDSIAVNLIYKIIKERKIEYFSYLKKDSETLNYIYDFIIKCKVNLVEFDVFIKNEKKLDAIREINLNYESFKMDNKLYDIADIEERVYYLFKNEQHNFKYFNDFNKVYITNSFFIDKTNFFTSKYQEMIFNLLKNIFESYDIPKLEIKKTTLVKVKQEIFDNIDEIKTAFKIVRKLMLSGVKDDDILIVTTDIEEYAPVFRLFIDEYGLKGYDSIGIPLLYYKGKYFKGNDLIKKSYQDFLLNFNSIVEKSKKLNIEIEEESLKFRLLKNTFVLNEKVGIELTEANQLIGSSKQYKHLIFIGVDIEHFPPKSEDNLFYSIKDAIKYFYVNNYYDSSEIQLKELKRISENLYILNANYRDKKKLAPSVLISEKFNYEIDISNIKSKNDLVYNKQISKPDESLGNYIKSINNIFFTDFDGIGVENIKINHLSASQLNKYSNCPLSYLYEYTMKIKTPKKNNTGFDILEVGTLMHKAFERFGKYVKEGRYSDYHLMKSVVDEIKREEIKKIGKINVFHRIIFEDFKKGLEEGEDKGVLSKFVDYINYNKEKFEFFKNTEFEKKFYLNNNFKIVNIKDENKESFFIKGFIDRIDNLDDYINIIDYKSKSNVNQIKENGKIKEFKEFQLLLYMLYAKKNYDKDIISSFLTFKVKNKDYLEYGMINTNKEKSFKLVNKGKKNQSSKEIAIYFNDDFEAKLKNKILEIKNNIEDGFFYFNNIDDDLCKYCNIKNLCNQSLLTKEL